MTRCRKFTDNALRELHSQGLTVKEIAEKLGVSEATVLRHARKLGLSLKRKCFQEPSALEESEDTSKKRAKGDRRSSFLPPPSGGWPM